jgi:hypothetical protein
MLRSILGLCTYYWWFTAGFADTAEPLPHSWKKCSPKLSLCTASILEYPRLSEKFINTASNVWIGGVLSQVQELSTAGPHPRLRGITARPGRCYWLQGRWEPSTNKSMDKNSTCAPTVLPWPDSILSKTWKDKQPTGSNIYRSSILDPKINGGRSTPTQMCSLEGHAWRYVLIAKKSKNFYATWRYAISLLPQQVARIMLHWGGSSRMMTRSSMESGGWKAFWMGGYCWLKSHLKVTGPVELPGGDSMLSISGSLPMDGRRQPK